MANNGSCRCTPSLPTLSTNSPARAGCSRASTVDPVTSQPNWCRLWPVGWLIDNNIGGTLHQMRHWFGNQVHAATGDLRVTQELMGHASQSTTASYVAWNQRSGIDAIANITSPLSA